jgi:hypothetical protein
LLGEVLLVCVVGLVVVAGLSLPGMSAPATPSFAKRAPTSGSPQLRQDSNAGYLHDRGFLFRRRVWFVATCCAPVRIDLAHYRRFVSTQMQQPVSIARAGGRVWWWFEGSFYWESGGYSQRDVLALIRDRQRRATQRLDRAHMLLNIEDGTAQRPPSRRQPIPREVRRAVFERDGGRCVECASNFDLQYDHVIPVALGGGGTFENLQLLCGECNRRKAADL